jgi:hypothetical protein
MSERIRFTQVVDGRDGRHWDFDTERIQIGADPSRGDNLLIDLPAGIRHVRARVKRTNSYVELEVRGGPIWLQGAEMGEGDVAELNLGDVLVFGTKEAKGPRLRFGHATEAEIVMDDVADWSVQAAPKPKRGKDAESDLLFKEEIDEYAGLNWWEKTNKFLRKQNQKLAFFRKKAARLDYWLSVAKVIKDKAGMGMMLVGAAGGIGYGYWAQIKAKTEALGLRDKWAEQAKLAVSESRDAQQKVTEIETAMEQCGCANQVAAGPRYPEAENAILERFGTDETLNPSALVFVPGGQESYTTLLGKPYRSFQMDKGVLPKVIERVCSASKDKERMDLVQRELERYGLHESYAFVPFVESAWCEIAVSPTGPRGMMQFTRDTAEEAFRKVDTSQADIPNYDFRTHRQWLSSYATQKRYGDLFPLLADCSSLLISDYRKQFYGGETNPKFPKRVDPNDPRTDWEWSTRASMAWLDYLDDRYESKGFRETDRILLAMWAYNQGEGEVQNNIKLARETYKIEQDSNLTFPQIYGAALTRAKDEEDKEKRGRILEGAAYGPKVIGSFLAAAPKLDAKQCRQ